MLTVGCLILSYVGHQASLRSCMLLYCLVQRESAGLVRAALGHHVLAFNCFQDGWEKTSSCSWFSFDEWYNASRSGSVYELRFQRSSWAMNWTTAPPGLSLISCGVEISDLRAIISVCRSSALWLGKFHKSGVTALSLPRPGQPPSMPVSSHNMCGLCLGPDLSQVLAAPDYILSWWARPIMAMAKF